MLSFNQQSYIPFDMEYDEVPYNNELVILQELRLSKKECYIDKPLINEDLLTEEAV